MLSADLPFVDRVGRIHECGLEAEMSHSSTKGLLAIAVTGVVIIVDDPPSFCLATSPAGRAFLNRS